MKKHLAASLFLCCTTMLAAAQTLTPPTGTSQELQKLFEEDQADRASDTGKPSDWEAIGLRDDARQKRISALIGEGSLHTGADYYHAAMILQHGSEPNDFLLAHGLCVIALSKGESRAKWLAAATLDRFLRSVGRQQRYGTQFTQRFPRPPRLAPVDPDMPDSLRREMDVPTLDEARAKEARMMGDFEARQRAKQVGQAEAK